jgi:hypothetical protein
MCYPTVVPVTGRGRNCQLVAFPLSCGAVGDRAVPICDTSASALGPHDTTTVIGIIPGGVS